MTLRIRQIVLAVHDLAATVSQFERELGLQVVYRDPQVGEFGLHNALMPVGDQFIEVLAPLRDDTAAGRHLARHGDSAYMLILQTDDLARDRARLDRLGVRVVWQSDYPDMCAAHLHPKDIGAAIVSLDQPSPPQSWRWAGPEWGQRLVPLGQAEICDATIGAVDPAALAQRWSVVLGTDAPVDQRIALTRGELRFTKAAADVIVGFRIARYAQSRTVTLAGTQFICQSA
jgi:catechol 2,3-dioxygenase-like lactoylglutathione lyase family enzyme